MSESDSLSDMENDRTDPRSELADLAGARAKILRRTRTPGWYLVVLGALMAMLVFTVGEGIGTWWYLPAIAAVIIGVGVIIGALRRVSGVWARLDHLPAWVGIWSLVLAFAPVITAVVLHYAGAQLWAIALLAVASGVVVGVGTRMLEVRWVAQRSEAA